MSLCYPDTSLNMTRQIVPPCRGCSKKFRINKIRTGKIRKILRRKLSKLRIFKLILKYRENRRNIEYIIKKNNLKYTDVIENGNNLISMMVHHKIHYGKVIKEAIEEGVDIMMPINGKDSELLAVAIFKAGGELI